MTPATKTIGILAAAGGLVASSLLLQLATPNALEQASTKPPAAAMAVSRYLTATVESSHALRGVFETHVAVTIKAPTSSSARPPVSIAIVFDRSGSMEGKRLAHAKQAASELIDKLSPADSFSVTVYGSEVETIVSHRAASDEARASAHAAITRVRASGGTNLSAGLTAASAELEKVTENVRRIVLISDGKANAGLIYKDQLAALASETAVKGITTTTVGVGIDFDEIKMTALAVAGRGNYYYAEQPASLAPMFQRELGRITATTATHVDVGFDAAEGIEVLGAYGFTLSKARTALADLHAGESRRIIFRIRGRAKVNGPIRLGTATLSLTDVETGRRISEKVETSVTITDDHHAVTSGLDPSAVADIERARSAVSLQKATALYEVGDAAGARRVIRESHRKARARANEIGAADLGAEFDGFAGDAEASFAPAPRSAEGRTARKRNRAKSFDLLH